MNSWINHGGGYHAIGFGRYEGVVIDWGNYTVYWSVMSDANNMKQGYWLHWGVTGSITRGKELVEKWIYNR